VGIGVIAACAFAFSLGMRALERVLVPWNGKFLMCNAAYAFFA